MSSNTFFLPLLLLCCFVALFSVVFLPFFPFLSRKLAVASWSPSCFSKEGGSPGPECCYLIYQDYTPPLAGFSSTLLLLGTCCCCCCCWHLICAWLLAACWLLLLAACMLAAAGCWLPAACCLLRFAGYECASKMISTKHFSWTAWEARSISKPKFPTKPRLTLSELASVGACQEPIHSVHFEA